MVKIGKPGTAAGLFFSLPCFDLRSFECPQRDDVVSGKAAPFAR
jgi:hypothetical protein